MMKFSLALLLTFTSLLFAQTKPLIMQHADSLTVSKRYGFMNLKGHVHFIHDSVQFKTMRASWNKNSDIVQCEDNFLFTHPKGFIKAKTGVYQKKINYASATGDVHAADSAQTYAMWGDRLQYDRENGVVTIPSKPFLHQYSRDKEGKIDTVAIRAESIVYREKEQVAEAHRKVVAMDSAGTYAFFGEELTYDRKNGILKMPKNPLLHQYSKNKNGKIDTVAIKAETITFNQNSEYAEAYRNVVLTQAGMTVTCDTGYLDKKNGWLALTGHPKCLLENHELTGDSIFMKLSADAKSIQSALVIRNAHGIQNEPGKGRKPGSHTEAFGDTLYAEFDGQKLKRLYVNLNAHGFFYEDDLPDYQNQLEGGRLDMLFEDGKMRLAKVSGTAQSTYFYVKEDRTVSGKNLASGDTIILDFNPIKNVVKKLKVRGGGAFASGRYIDLERSRMKSMGLVVKDSAEVKTSGKKEPAVEKEAPAEKADTTRTHKLQERMLKRKMKPQKDAAKNAKETSDGKQGTDKPGTN